MPISKEELIKKIGETFSGEGDEFPRMVFSICAEMYGKDPKKEMSVHPDDVAMLSGLQSFFEEYPQIIPKGLTLNFAGKDVEGTGYKDYDYEKTFDSIKGEPIQNVRESPKIPREAIESPKKYVIYGDGKEVSDHEVYAKVHGSKIFTSIAHNRLTVQMDQLNNNKEIPEEIHKLIKEELKILLRRDFKDDRNNEKLILLAELTRLINNIFNPESNTILQDIEKYNTLMETLKDKPFFKEHSKPFVQLQYEDIYLKKLETIHNKESVDALLQGSMKHSPEDKKTVFLDKLAKKIHELETRGGQNPKKMALCDIYFQFKKLDFSNPKDVQNIRTLIAKSRPQLKTFDSTSGKVGAYIKQLFFNSGYGKTTSNTEMLVNDLWDFIDPSSRVRVRKIK